MGAISAADRAQAAEAFNRHAKLSTAARRLGIELLNRSDNHTGLCFPSEARLAESLGYTIRTINRAKRELKHALLLSWKCRGQHKTPIYKLAWDLLKTLALVIKKKIKAAFTPKAPAPVKKTENNQNPLSPSAPPAPNSDRTFPSAYLTQLEYNKTLDKFKLSTAAGSFKSPKTPPQQFLSDQQLDNRASGRMWAALQCLGRPIVEAFIAHPKATELETGAIKAERYAPRGTPPGQAAISFLKGALAC